MADAIHAKIFQVRAVDIDQGGFIQPVVFLDYLLEAAGEQAAFFRLAVTDLFEKGRTWVLSRFHVRFARYPRWGEHVEIKTWPSDMLPLYALRDFEATAGSGIIARATSSWLIVDLATRRPIRTSEHLGEFPKFERRVIDDGFSPLPSLSREDRRMEFPVFFSDLDINRHVTATVYVQRALETVPEDVLFGYRPASIEVNFRGEAFYGDRIVSRLERIRLPGSLVETAANAASIRPAESKSDPGPPRLEFLHRLSRASDDKELTLLRTSWDWGT